LAGAALVACAGFGACTQAVAPLRVSSDSMAPTLRPGSQVVVDKLSRRFAAPLPGSVVVLHEPGSGDLVVKRVVAAGGQRVEVEDGVLVVDGRPRREPYADRRGADSVYYGPVRVPEGEVFVLGDNRGRSVDSLDYGPVPLDDVVGKVVWHS
jgi:signal peptidase I